jgi:hypothetical protein
MSTLHEEKCTVLIISHLFLLRIRNISDRICRKNENTFYLQYFFFENRAFYDIIWKNIVEPGRPQKTIWRRPIACWIPKATNTHSKYVILIAFSLQKWLLEQAFMLRCK